MLKDVHHLQMRYILFCPKNPRKKIIYYHQLYFNWCVFDFQMILTKINLSKVQSMCLLMILFNGQKMWSKWYYIFSFIFIASNKKNKIHIKKIIIFFDKARLWFTTIIFYCIRYEITNRYIEYGQSWIDNGPIISKTKSLKKRCHLRQALYEWHTVH